MNATFLVLRIVVGALFMGHGSQKLFGWFGGGGPWNTGRFFESIGFGPGLPFALLAGLGEVFGGLLLAVGLFMPVAALLLIGVMASAIAAVHWSKDVWNANGGLELPLVMATVAFTLAAVGPGTLSLDNAFGIDWHGIWWALGAAALGAAGGLASALTRRTAPAKEAERERHLHEAA